MQKGFFFDQTRCTNCYTCIVACKDWHDVPAGPASWINITAIEKGQYPNLSLKYLFGTCYHCAEPLCVKACKVNAIYKRAEDGIVVVDKDICIGGEECGFACRKACPYNIPQFGSEPNPKMQKCDLCLDRWKDNNKPICVEACPMRALDAGEFDELKTKYGNKQQAEGFVYNNRVMPSIIFKSNMTQ